jgi:murein DD-endopeptidase MepM/ murein hydrolase activator NlpD
MNRRKKTFMGILAALLAILMILPILITILSPAGAVTQAEIDRLKEEAAQLAQKKADLKNQMSSIENEQKAINAKKELIDQQIDTTKEEIKNLDMQIALLEAQIIEKEEEYRLAQEEEAKQYEIFKARVRAMEENGTISYFSILFDARDFGDLLGRLDFISEIMEYDENVVKNLEDAQAATERIRLELETTLAETESYRQSQVRLQAEMEAQLEAANEMFRQLEANKTEYQLAYEENERLEAEKQAEIDRKIEEYERQKAKGIVSTGTYIWPSADSTYVTSLFGGRTHPIFGTYKNHNGIDIGASYGTAIYASDSGTVVTSEYSYSYGNYVMIAHGNGRYTLYAHMSERHCKVDDKVSQGDTIGLVGSTGYSTGPHIHFEIIENGVRIDPLQFFSNYTVSPNA